MLRVVFDTSVLVAALRSSNGASYALLDLIDTDAIRPLCSTALFLEYEAVLKRPEQRLVHGLDVADIDRILAVLASATAPVEIHISWRPQLADADDELVLEAAINGRADVLVTHNVKDFGPAQDFGVRVVTPGSLLKELQT